VHTKVQKRLFERQETMFICKIWSVSMLLDPDPHAQYGSGSLTATMNADPDP
jgi:hypothetical protein